MLASTEKSQKCRLALGFLVFVASGICYSLHAPLFPTQALNKGSTRLWVGGITGSFDIVGVITAFTPVFFNLKDVKFCFIAGIFLGGVGTILFGVANFIDESVLCYNFVCLALRLGCQKYFACYFKYKSKKHCFCQFT